MRTSGKVKPASKTVAKRSKNRSPAPANSVQSISYRPPRQSPPEMNSHSTLDSGLITAIERGNGEWFNVPLCVRQTMVCLLRQKQVFAPMLFASPERVASPERSLHPSPQNHVTLPNEPLQDDSDHTAALQHFANRKGAMTPRTTIEKDVDVDQPSVLPGTAWRPSSKGQRIFDASGVVSTFGEASKYRSTAMRSLNDLMKEVERLDDDVTDYQSAQTLAAIQLDPNLMRKLKVVATHADPSTLRRVPKTDDVITQRLRDRLQTQEHLWHTFVTSLSESREHLTAFLAEFLTDEEKRHLGLNTHKFQTQLDRRTKYQYVASKVAQSTDVVPSSTTRSSRNVHQPEKQSASSDPPSGPPLPQILEPPVTAAQRSSSEKSTVENSKNDPQMVADKPRKEEIAQSNDSDQRHVGEVLLRSLSPSTANPAAPRPQLQPSSKQRHAEASPIPPPPLKQLSRDVAGGVLPISRLTAVEPLKIQDSDSDSEK